MDNATVMVQLWTGTVVIGDGWGWGCLLWRSGGDTVMLKFVVRICVHRSAFVSHSVVVM